MSRRHHKRSKSRMTRDENDKTGYIPLVIAFLILISISIMTLNTNNEIPEDEIVSYTSAEDPPPGTNQSQEKLDIENTSTTYNSTQCLTHLMSFGSIFNCTLLENETTSEDSNDTSAPTSYTPSLKLIEDNRFCFTYFQYRLNWGNLLVRVDANTQEILYVHNSLISNGEISMGEAQAIANNILGDLAADVEKTEPDNSEECDLEVSNVEDIENEDDTTTTITGYRFTYIREASADPYISSSDRIIILIDSSGELMSFRKTWNLDFPADTTASLSEESALDEAATYLDDPSGYIISELMVVRPNYFWTLNEVRYGFDDGILCWVFTEYTDATYKEVKSSVWVDADSDDGGEGDVVGGYI